MAAGRGTRLGPLTADNPKTLVEVGGRPILEHILSIISPLVAEAIVVVGYKADKIKARFGPRFSDLPIRYVEQKKLAGTADALWQTRPYLKPGKFLVLNGDDLYNTEDLRQCLKEELVIGLTQSKPMGASYEVISLNNEGFVASWRKVLPEEMSQKVLIISGAYVLDQRIFGFDPVAISSTEYGLPQTILAMSKTHPVRGVIMRHWVPVNRPEDIVVAENLLKQNPGL